jgi:glycosyltransferase involved in cell wall biosynthesis
VTTKPIKLPPEEIKVSVCVVTYNHERYIAQALESALCQHTTFQFEIVIGEDCSTDRTREILNDLATKHPDIIRLRLAPRNQGASRNFAQTFADCRGQYVIILEGDDYWTSPNKLQAQVDALDAHPDWAICFHPALCIYEDDAAGPPRTPEHWDRSEVTIRDLFAQNFMATSSVMFRNRLFGTLPDWFVDVGIGDWALHILNADHGKIGFLPDEMSAYRIHAGGIFSCLSLDEKLIAISRMLSTVNGHFKGKYSREIEANRSTTLRWLVGELYNANRKAATAAELEKECERLRENVIVLESFRDKWSRSLLYRVHREVHRIWQRMQNRFSIRKLSPSMPPASAPKANSAT